MRIFHIRFHPAAKFRPIHSGHHEIADYHIYVLSLVNDTQCFSPIRCRNHIIAPPHGIRNGCQKLLVVINQQHSHFLAGIPPFYSLFPQAVCLGNLCICRK